MKRGTCKHPVTPGSVVNIRTDAEFTVYALHKGERTSILGPNHSTERRLKMHVPFGVHNIEVTTRKSGRWEIEETIPVNHKEKIDNTPIEMGVREKVDPLAEQIQAIVSAEMSKYAASQGRETFVEANDFDIADEEDPTSQYELSPMQEDFEPEPPSVPPDPQLKTPETSQPTGEVSDVARPVQADKTPSPTPPPATPPAATPAPRAAHSP